MLVLLAALVSLACIAASGHRLRLAIAPTPYDLDLLLAALKHPGALPKLREGLSGTDCWERDVLEAASASPAAARAALLDEQVVEADWATERWMRAPRVAASVATSAGFLCASLVLIQALGSSVGSSAGSGEMNLGGPVDGDAAAGPLALALDALAVGIAGTAFCVAVHLRAQSVTRQRRKAVDQLVDQLRAPGPSNANS
jgi:hypothetical protein